MTQADNLIEQKLLEGNRINPRYLRLDRGSGADIRVLIKEVDAISKELRLWQRDNVVEVIAHVPDEWIPYWK